MSYSRSVVPRRDQPRRAALGVDQPDFGGLVVVHVDGDEAPAQRLADTDEEARIGFLEDDLVVVLRRAEQMPAHAERAVAVVELGVVERPSIGRPGAPSAASVMTSPVSLPVARSRMWMV